MSDETQVPVEEVADAAPVAPVTEAPVETVTDTAPVAPDATPVAPEAAPVEPTPVVPEVAPEAVAEAPVEPPTPPAPTVTVVELFGNVLILSKKEVDLSQFPNLQGYFEISLADGTQNRVHSSEIKTRTVNS